MASNSASRVRVGAMSDTSGSAMGTNRTTLHQSSQVSSFIWKVQSEQSPS
jgi:hypothetical protein